MSFLEHQHIIQLTMKHSLCCIDYAIYDIKSACFVIEVGYGTIVASRYSLRFFLVAIYFLTFYMIVIRIDLL